MSVVAGKIQTLLEFYEADAVRSGAIRHVLDLVIQIGNGTSEGEVDLIYSRPDESVAASATDSHDLAGTLLDAVGGDVITMKEVVAIVVVNHSTTAGDNLQVGPAALNGCLSFWADPTDRVKVAPGISASHPGFAVLYAPRGFTVTATTGDLIEVIETGGVNTVEYEIYLLGRSA